MTSAALYAINILQNALWANIFYKGFYTSVYLITSFARFIPSCIRQGNIIWRALLHYSLEAAVQLLG